MSARSTKRSDASWLPVPSALLACALAAALGGCVSASTHQRTVDEVVRLEQKVMDRDRSIAALEEERAKLLSEIEDLRDARQSLRADVADREKKIQGLRGTYDELVKDLEAEVAGAEARLELITEGLLFQLPQDALFAPGSAELTATGRKAVKDLAPRLHGGDRIEVQGHTDDRPIKGALAQRYPSNWELAGARAASVVRVLEQSGVASDRLSAVSFGPSRPLASNDTPEGRAQNRRIEVRVVQKPTAAPAAAAEPTAEPAPPAEPSPQVPPAAGAAAQGAGTVAGATAAPPSAGAPKVATPPGSE
jgi:chemotaxis protein MotB